MLMLLFSFLALAASPADSFKNIKNLNSHIVVEMRYSSIWNFMGQRIDGYKANKCLLSTEAAAALAKVQTEVEAQGYSLLMLDCYRPQRAVDQFVRWTQNSRDQQMKAIFYPNEPKETLIDRGYIASHSGHSSGSTVDLTLVKRIRPPRRQTQWPYQEAAVDCRKQVDIEKTGQLDMGTSFDCFDPLANTASSDISSQAKKNRQILIDAMSKFGFYNYPQEWWHFTLTNEPYKGQYFDVVVK